MPYAVVSYKEKDDRHHKYVTETGGSSRDASGNLNYMHAGILDLNISGFDREIPTARVGNTVHSQFYTITNDL